VQDPRRRREWPVVEQRAALYGSAATLRGLCLVVVTGIPATAQSTGNLHKAVSCKQGSAWVLGRLSRGLDRLRHWCRSLAAAADGEP
jgi:hypothetical protein